MMPLVPTLLLDLLPEWLAEEFRRAGLPPVQSLRLLKALFRAGEESALDEASLGKSVLAFVRGRFQLRGASLLRRALSSDGTAKLLLAMRHGGLVETVLMPAHRSDRAAAVSRRRWAAPWGADSAPRPATVWSGT